MPSLIEDYAVIGNCETFALVGAIASGFLIAAMVWLLTSAEAAQFHVIVVITYFIAAAGFMHTVAGSVEAFFRYQKGHSTSKQWP